MAKFVCIEIYRDGTRKAKFTDGNSYRSVTKKELKAAIRYRTQMALPKSELEIGLAELGNTPPLQSGEKE